MIGDGLTEPLLPGGGSGAQAAAVGVSTPQLARRPSTRASLSGDMAGVGGHSPLYFNRRASIPGHASPIAGSMG